MAGASDIMSRRLTLNIAIYALGLLSSAGIATHALSDTIMIPDRLINSCYDSKLAPEKRIERCKATISSKKTPKDDLPLAYNARGTAHFQNKEYDLAIKDFDESIKLLPKNAAAYYNRSVSYFGKGNIDQAILDIRLATSYDAKNSTYWRQQCFLYLTKGVYTQAIQDCAEALKIDPKNTAALINRGYSYSKNGEFNLAVNDFKEATEIDPKLENAFGGLCLAYNNLRSYSVAIESCTTAIKLNPKYFNAYMRRGRAYFKRGELDRAIADYNNALKIKQDNPNFNNDNRISAEYRDNSIKKDCFDDIADPARVVEACTIALSIEGLSQSDRNELIFRRARL